MLVNKTVIKLFKYEDDLTSGQLSERQPHKTQDNFTGKITSGDDLSGRRHHQLCIKFGQANGPSLFST